MFALLKPSPLTLNLQTDLNFIGSPVKYSCGVTALANISSKKAPEHGACTRNATMFPITDWKKVDVNIQQLCIFTILLPA
jgi:hypothetical protein